MLIASFDVKGIVHTILATKPDRQPAHLQGRAVTFDAVSTREEVALHV